MKLKNKKPGAKVKIPKLLVEISPKVKWRYLKNLTGVIVPMKEEYEQYWHTSSGAHTYVTKHLIKNDCFPTYAIKLDNGVVDIEGNNIIVVREFNLKFLELLPKTFKQVTYSDYRKSLKVIEKYEYQKTLL